MIPRLLGLLFALGGLAVLGVWMWLDGVSPRGIVAGELAFVVGAVLVSLPSGRLLGLGRDGRGQAVSEVVLDANGSRLLLLRPGGHVASLDLSDGALGVGPDAFPDGPGATLTRAQEATYGDVARLWLTGERRHTLHGLHGGGCVPEFVSGALLLTPVLREAPPDPLPVLVAHAESLNDGAAELLTRLELVGGAESWTARFVEPTLVHATHLVLTEDRVVVILRGPGGPQALALAWDTGAQLWKVRL